MKPHEIRNELDRRLTTGAAAEYWAGCSGCFQDEAVVVAQRKGIDAAVRLIEDLAEPIGDQVGD